MLPFFRFLYKQWGQWSFSEEKYSDPSMGTRYFPPSNWHLTKCLPRCRLLRNSAKMGAIASGQSIQNITKLAVLGDIMNTEDCTQIVSLNTILDTSLEC